MVLGAAFHGPAQASELYNHTTGRSSAPLTAAQQLCNDDIFTHGTILAETTTPELRQTPEQQEEANRRIYLCINAYGNGETPAMVLVSFSQADSEACTLYLFAIEPGEGPTERILRRYRLECTSSRLDSEYGPDEQGVYQFDEFWPSRGVSLPKAPGSEALYKENAVVPQHFAPAFLKFHSETINGREVVRGFHGYPYINDYGGSRGCIRMLPSQLGWLLNQFYSLGQQWRGRTADGWLGDMPIFLAEQQTTR
jgi:hypothetical protein